MSARVFPLSEVQPDSPIERLQRQRVVGERMLFALVHLEKGCQVAPHRHESEQVAYVISGRVRWQLGDPETDSYREEEVEGGSVVLLPSNVQHSVFALEDTVIADILSPPAAMGVDSQGR